MLHALATPHNRRVTLGLLAACGVTAAAAALVGISDNPPGIILALLSAAAFFLAFTHPWRTPRPYLRLLGASVLGLVLFAVLHNVFEAIGGMVAGPGPLRSLLQTLFLVLSITSFSLAILVCPPAIALGALGAAFMFARNHWRRPQDGEIQG